MKKIKLNQLANEKLQNQEMKLVQGGYEFLGGGKDGHACGCGCYYENNGGSTTNANMWANHAGGLMSPL